MSEKKEGLELKTVIGGILQGLREAKYLGDLESAQLIKVYQENPVLARLPVPSFGISNIEVELHFNIIGLSEKSRDEHGVPNVKIDISAEKLSTLEPHQTQLMKLKMNPITLRVLEEDK